MIVSVSIHCICIGMYTQVCCVGTACASGVNGTVMLVNKSDNLSPKMR